MATCVENCRAKSAFLRWTAAAADDSFCKFSAVCSPQRSCAPIGPAAGDNDDDDDEVWAELQAEALSDVEDEPILRQYYSDLILSHRCLESALAAHLAAKLCVPGVVSATVLHDLLLSALADGGASARRAVRADLRAARDRDPACAKTVHCFLHYKGFLALQAHRAAHRLWGEGRRAAALLLQGRASEAFAVDIHPAAVVGEGVLLDHATGVVIGETAVVGSHVSILHGVTLGGTGKEGGDRHPMIGDGVLIGAGAHILGRIRIGDGAKIGAGSVVLKEVPARTTAVGNPARPPVGGKESPVRPEGLPGLSMDHTSWSRDLL